MKDSPGWLSGWPGDTGPVVERGVLFLSARSLPPDRDPDRKTMKEKAMNVEVTEVVVADRHEALQKLVALRKAKKLRQVDVAARMGIGQPSVSELERGEVPPKVETLEKYAAAISGTLKFVVLDIVEKEGETDGSGDAEHGV